MSRAVNLRRALSLPRRGAVKLLHAVGRHSRSWAGRLEPGDGYSSEDAQELEKNGALRGRHRGRRAFVIGNGPSLAAQDLSPLANEVTLVVNAFHKHPILERWQPTYYCIADSTYFDGSGPMSAFFSDIRSHVRSTTYMVPLSGREVARSMGLLPIEHTHFIAFRGSLPGGLGSGPELTAAIPAVQSVSQLAIMAAMYMGCSPIYLLGMDHDWLSKRGMDRHFYEGNPIQGHAEAHADLDRVPYIIDLEAAVRLWRGYEQIQLSALRGGVQILNATGGGFLDVFPLASYESLI